MHTKHQRCQCGNTVTPYFVNSSFFLVLDISTKFYVIVVIFLQVNLHALQLLPKIMPALSTQSGALIPPIISALTANLASKNSNIFSSADVALDEFSKYIGI